MITLYGIKNCDTVKKARHWLETHGIEFRFHDFREDGLTPGQVDAWLEALGWENLVNRRSTSWKALTPEQRENMSRSTARAAILEQPTLIKRPLLDTGHELHCGFSADSYTTIFNQHTL